MANVSITLTTSQANAARVVAWMRAKLSQPGDDTLSDMEFAKKCTVRWWTNGVLGYEDILAHRQAETTIPPVMPPVVT